MFPFLSPQVWGQPITHGAKANEVESPAETELTKQTPC